MKHLKRIFLLMMLCLAPIVAAQEDCVAIVQQALQAMDSACTTTGRNEACYGNIVLTATPHEDTSDFVFEKAGDIVPVQNIQTLQLSSMSLTDETWGVALVKVQANLPETVPGQNVTVLLFGDVQMEDKGQSVIPVELVATNGVNVRSHPTTESANVVDSLASGETVTANGRLADNSWVHLVNANGSGWVSAQFLEGDIDSLTVIEPDAAVFGPMQAFYLHTGVNDAPCAEVPDSGILIQTPQGAGLVELLVNEVRLQLGSTIYVQANEDTMTVSVIEGHAILTADGVTQIVPAGTSSRILLDENGAASGQPEYPQPYTYERMRVLPVNSTSLEKVTVEEATAENQIADAIASLTTQTTVTVTDTQATDSTAVTSIGDSTSTQNADQPPTGTWTSVHITRENTCDPSKIPVGNVSNATASLTFSADRSSFLWDWGNGESYTFVSTGGASYIRYVNQQATESITFITPTSYIGEHLGLYGDCTYIDDLSGSFIG